MPDPPDTSFLVRHVLEQPWPLALLLLVAGAVIGWTALRDGRLARLRVAGPVVASGAAVLLAGLLVTTPGEHARAVTRAFVDAVVQEDIVAAGAMLTEDAKLHVGAPTNPGFDADAIVAGLVRLVDRFTIEDNRIAHLDAFTESPDAGVVHMACFTDVGSGFGRTRWHLRVRRDAADGSWRICNLTWISLNDRTPTMRW